MARKEEILALMQEDEFEGLRELSQIGEEAVPVLLDILKSPSSSSFLRLRATVALGEIGSSSAARDVEALLSHAEPVQRLTAARALVRISGESASNTLAAAAEDPDPSVSKVLIQCLEKVGGRDALAVLDDIRARTQHEFLRTQAEAAIKAIKKRTT